MTRLLLLVLASAFVVPCARAAEPSYTRDIVPFFKKYCLECHTGRRARNEFSLDTHAEALKGGISGDSFVPGEPDKSFGVLFTEHERKPVMPPRNYKAQPKSEEVKLLREWVKAGAKDDSKTPPPKGAEAKPKPQAQPAVSALAYRPDGKLLAVAGYREVLLLDVATGDVIAKLGEQRPKVTALGFSKDGKTFAVASGEPGKVGEVRLYANKDKIDPKPLHVLTAHADLVHDLAFSPDGKTLATCSYDRLVKLWDLGTGKEVRTLKDHSDAVYGVAFRPDGKLLASVAADRAVKVWDVATGTRLYTLSEPTDWVYAVAWTPDGKHLTAAGVDKSIRVWQADENGGKIAHSVFAHEAAVTRLVYAPDGSRLYSLSEDRTIKAWDTARMVEARVYPKQPEVVLALAVRPDRAQLALGRYDGALVLMDEATGKVQSEPLPEKPKPPRIDKLSPASAPRGKPVRVRFEGAYLDTAKEVTAPAGVTVKIVPEKTTPNSVEADVTFPATMPAGVVPLGVKTAAGEASGLPFLVDLFEQTWETEGNDSPGTGQKVKLPASVIGSVGKPGDVDCYRFDAVAGQQLGVQLLTTPLTTLLDPVLVLADLDGTILAEGRGTLGHVFTRAGTYAIGVRDHEYRGGPDLPYRLHMGDVPVVTSVFPLGVQRGSEVEVSVQGVHLGVVKSVKVKAPADAVLGQKLPLSFSTPLGAPLGNPAVVVGEFPEVASPMTTIPVPGTAEGRITKPGQTDAWKFSAKKGQRLILEVSARRLGSPLDSVLDVLDAAGKPVMRATLRCVAKTNVIFRDHDSVGSGIRIEAWSELGVNDYLYVGSELLRIKALPKNPDDDCQFFSVAGQRLGFLDTTPTHHPLGEPMYKVTLHPPGTSFPPNGMPIFHLPTRNDDGGPGYGKDSRIFFDPPADGEYQVRIGDARGMAGEDFGYRLTVRPPRLDYSVTFSPTAPAVWKGGAVPISVTATRNDGFDDPIELRLEGLPAGFTAPVTTIPAGETTTAFALHAEPGATVPAGTKPIKLMAKAKIDGKDVVHEAAGGVPTAVEPGDLVTVTGQQEVTLKPGSEVRLTVTIERRNGFKGRVPLDVRGLPHGVRVLDIGLNGVLITERETTRTIVIYAEPWVEPTEHPFVVLARQEQKGTEHAAKSVLLKVKK